MAGASVYYQWLKVLLLPACMLEGYLKFKPWSTLICNRIRLEHLFCTHYTICRFARHGESWSGLQISRWSASINLPAAVAVAAMKSFACLQYQLHCNRRKPAV